MTERGTLGRGRHLAIVGAGISLAAGLAGALLRFSGDDPPLGWDNALAAFALGVAVALPGVIVLAAIRRSRPEMLVAAALVALPLALLSFVMLIPLLVSSILFVAAVARGRVRIPGAWAVASIVVGAALGIGAFFALFTTDDPVCWATLRNGSTVEVAADPFVRADGFGIDTRATPPGTVGSGCSSDSITPAEAVGSLLLSALAVVVPPLLPATVRGTRPSVAAG